MYIFEVAGVRESVDGELEALVTFLLGRAGDTGADKKISIEAFLNLADELGISLSKSLLIQMSQKPPLSNLIKNIDDDEVIFKGGRNDDSTTMPVDKARDVVSKMAKRAMKKK